MTGREERLFGLRDTVRLLNPHGDIPAGTLGSVLGWYKSGGNYLVNFADVDLPTEEARIGEVRADEIAAADFA